MTKTRAAAYRICILTSVHSPFDVRVFHKEGRSLARAGYEVTLIAPHERDEVVDGVVIKSLPSVGGRVSRMTRTVWRLYCEAVHQDADVYHFHDPELIPIGLLLRLRGKEVIYDIHEDVPASILSRSWIPRPLRRVVSLTAGFIEESAASVFSGVITADSTNAERFDRCNPLTACLENFPLLADFSEPRDAHSPAEGEGFIVNFGGVNPAHSIREIVSAMELLRSDLGARLVLGGDLSSPQLLNDLQTMPGWTRVQYIGVVPWKLMGSLYLKARAGLVLYSPHPNHYVVRSNRFYQTLAAGLPVITSNFPRWKEQVESSGCGVAVDPTDPFSIAEAISFMYQHPDKAAEMGQRGRSLFVNKFNWNREEPRLLEFYERVLLGNVKRG